MKPADNQNSSVKDNPRSTTEIRDDLFIKTSDELNLQGEAQELERCNKLSIRTPHVTPPEFITYDSESNQLTTRVIPHSQSLFNIIWNGTSFIGRLRGKRLDINLHKARMEEIGQWLRLYHDSTACPEHSQEVADNLLKMFKSKIDAIRHHKLLKERFLSRLEEHFFSEIEKLTDSQYQKDNHVRFCTVHGDFIAYNMMADPEWNIHVLDFGDTRIGTSFEDVARFYELLWAMAQTNRLRKNIFPKAIDVFLEAYGLPSDIGTAPFFLTVRALNGIIHCIAEHYQRQFVSYSYLTKWELQRITRASLRRISKEVSAPF